MGRKRRGDEKGYKTLLVIILFGFVLTPACPIKLSQNAIKCYSFKRKISMKNEYPGKS